MGEMIYVVEMSVTLAAVLALVLCMRMRRPIPDLLAVVVALSAVVFLATCWIQFFR